MAVTTILLTMAEKAAELQVHPETLRRWKREGHGPAWVQYGGKTRYYPEVIPTAPASEAVEMAPARAKPKVPAKAKPPAKPKPARRRKPRAA